MRITITVNIIILNSHIHRGKKVRLDRNRFDRSCTQYIRRNEK